MTDNDEPVVLRRTRMSSTGSLGTIDVPSSPRPVLERQRHAVSEIVTSGAPSPNQIQSENRDHKHGINTPITESTVWHVSNLQIETSREEIVEINHPTVVNETQAQPKPMPKQKSTESNQSQVSPGRSTSYESRPLHGQLVPSLSSGPSKSESIDEDVNTWFQQFSFSDESLPIRLRHGRQTKDSAIKDLEEFFKNNRGMSGLYFPREPVTSLHSEAIGKVKRFLCEMDQT